MPRYAELHVAFCTTPADVKTLAKIVEKGEAEMVDGPFYLTFINLDQVIAFSQTAAHKELWTLRENVYDCENFMVAHISRDRLLRLLED